jgi:peroxiredoxin
VHLSFLIALAAGLAYAQAPQTAAKLAEHINQIASREPAALAADVRQQAAEALERLDPELARKMREGVRPVKAEPRPTTTADPAASAIATRFNEMRGELSRADRAKLAESLAAQIQKLSQPQTRLGLATSLSNLATEGDLGHDALQTITDTLAYAIRDNRPHVEPRQYLDLAKLVRYEHMKSPIDDPSLESRLELLKLRDLAIEQTNFTLTSLDGKAYSLKDLRGKVVLVNFWATWCPPCRKEMPDLEALSKQYLDQGLVVLAISDESVDKVQPFISKQVYTFPILLDPGRKVNEAFHVEGIPKTFIFGRDGKLAAQSIDMRTWEQFLALLKQAGIK